MDRRAGFSSPRALCHCKPNALRYWGHWLSNGSLPFWKTSYFVLMNLARVCQLDVLKGSEYALGVRRRPRLLRLLTAYPGKRHVEYVAEESTNQPRGGPPLYGVISRASSRACCTGVHLYLRGAKRCTR